MPPPPPPSPLHLPKSYTTLPNHETRIHNNPPTSATVTPIQTLELYRPHNNNAFTDTMMAEIESSMALFSADDRVKCVIVTGYGRMFCAGADLGVGFGGGEEEERAHRDGGGRVSLAIHHCLKPVLAAINGPAVGVGITMLLPCTIRLAVSSAKIGFVFSRRGLVSEGASSYFLPRLIGYSRALHIVTTGSVYRADDALLGGLFSETLDSAAEVRGRALELAGEIVRNTSSVSNVLIRELMWRGPGSAEEAHLLDSRVLASLRGSEDVEEGVGSFLEKRAPVFRGTMGTSAPSVYPWWTPVDVRAPGRVGEVVKGKL
ncbi:MAG: hypothetical protein M1828_002935 [Chrysothrix sp. TS-e1954]|nr:MAG: hypothetical protein M1828_002935 [Chrysothrix sp. TS-e1954]